MMRGTAVFILLGILLSAELWRANAQAGTSAPITDIVVTVHDITPPQTCDEHGWRIEYTRDVTFNGDRAWRYFVQYVNDDINLVHYWGSGYSAYVQDYWVLNETGISESVSAYYAIPLWTTTYEAVNVEYVLDGDHVLWEIRTTLTCEAGVVTNYEIVSQAADLERDDLPEPKANLVLTMNDIVLFGASNDRGTREILGTIAACQTFFVSEIFTPRASITTYATIELTDTPIAISGVRNPPVLIDVAENYGQAGGQAIIDECAGD